MSQRGYPSASSSRRRGPMSNGAPVQPSEHTRRQMRRYYSTHTPEGLIDPNHDASSNQAVNGQLVGKKSRTSDHPRQLVPLKLNFRKAAFDYSAEADEGEESVMFMQDNMLMRYKPRLHLNRDLRIYQITQVTSPTQFYMVEVSPGSEIPNQHRRLARWWLEMQILYDLPDSEYRLRVESVPRVGHLYVLYYSYLTSWERARVVTVDEIRKQCRVFFIDAGVFADRSWNDFKELVPDWAEPNPLAMVGRLQDVYPTTLMDGKIFNSSPPEEAEKPSRMWPKAAVDFMKTRSEGKFFYGVNIQDSRIAITKMGHAHEIVPQYIKFGMVFVELSLRSGKTLNAELCLNGHAICTGMGASAACTFSNGPRFTDLLLNQNATIGLILSQEMNDVTYQEYKDLAEAMDSTKMESFAYDHIIESPQDLVTWRTHGLRDEELEQAVDRIPELIRTNANLCDITVINSPSCFYVLPASRIRALRAISKFVASKIQKPGFMDSPTPIAPHEINIGDPIVLCQRFFHNNYFGSKPAWYRAVVKQVYTNLHRVRAALVDVGLEVRAHVVDVYSMPYVLQSIPALCFRAHLNVPNWGPAPSNFWSSGATERFRSSQPLWFEGDPAYYVWESFPKNRVELDVFNQNLTYSGDGSCTWDKVPFDPNTVISSAHITEFNADEINDIRQEEKALVEEEHLKAMKLREKQAEEARKLAANYTRLTPGVQRDAIEHEVPAINYEELEREPRVTETLIEDLFLPPPSTVKEWVETRYRKRRNAHRNKVIQERNEYNKAVWSRNRKYNCGELKLTEEEVAQLKNEVFEINFQLSPSSTPSSTDSEDGMNDDELRLKYAQKMKELENIRDRIKRLCTVEKRLNQKEHNSNGGLEDEDEGVDGDNAAQQGPSLIAGRQYPNYKPFRRVDNVTFNTLCGPLFTSIGVNFSYELDFEKRPSVFHLFKASAILRMEGHVKRIEMRDEGDSDKKESQTGAGQASKMRIRVLPEKYDPFKSSEEDE